MAVADLFPVDADYVVARTRRPEQLVHRAASGEEFVRTTAPLARVFDLNFNGRSVADWTAIENFRLKMIDDFFDFFDKTAARNFSCRFAGEPQFDEVGFERVNIRATLVEAAGKPLSTYPQTPLITLGQTGVVVSDGIVFTYPGYGYKITGSGITGVTLDGVALGITLQKFDVALLYHVLKVSPAGATVTKVEFVH